MTNEKQLQKLGLMRKPTKKAKSSKLRSLYTEEEIRDAVSYAIGDDGFRATEVIAILKQFRS